MRALDRARVRVDFNEMVSQDLVLLSREEHVTDSNGQRIELRAGDRMYLYADDTDDDVNPSLLLATGLAEVNTANDWSSHVKWCCRIDAWGDCTATASP